MIAEQQLIFRQIPSVRFVILISSNEREKKTPSE